MTTEAEAQRILQNAVSYLAQMSADLRAMNDKLAGRSPRPQLRLIVTEDEQSDD